MGKRITVGLDIGSSAVRAVEVETQGTVRELTRFAQVGLPQGAVVEGEVKDRGAVASAVKRLWSEGGFREREVVLGISSQRSMVRPVDMPKMATSELRSALRYEISELLPIPVDQAVFDFVPLGPGKPAGDGGETVRVLLVVAQREIVMDQMTVVESAGLKVRAVDSSPLAVSRAFAAPAGGGLEAVLNLGSQLVVVTVREDGMPRFVRTVTKAVGARSAVAQESGAGGSGIGAVATRPSPGWAGERSDSLIEEVRGSLEFFHSHNEGVRVSSALLTGGGALQEGLTERLGSALGVPVRRGEVSLRCDPKRLSMTDRQVQDASVIWATAAGLALWGLDDGPAPSLIPAEARYRKQFRQALVASGAGLLVVAMGLGAVSYKQVDAASNVAAQIRAENAQAAQIRTRIASLQQAATVSQELQSRRALATTALTGDINLVALAKRLERALPGNVKLTSLTLNRGGVSASSSSTSGSATPSASSAIDTDIGSISMSLTATGGPPSVATFVRKMWDVRGVYALWVSGANTTASPAGSVTTFSATAQITSAALSDRQAKLPGRVP